MVRTGPKTPGTRLAALAALGSPVAGRYGRYRWPAGPAWRSLALPRTRSHRGDSINTPARSFRLLAPHRARGRLGRPRLPSPALAQPRRLDAMPCDAMGPARGAWRGRRVLPVDPLPNARGPRPAGSSPSFSSPPRLAHSRTIPVAIYNADGRRRPAASPAAPWSAWPVGVLRHEAGSTRWPEMRFRISTADPDASSAVSASDSERNIRCETRSEEGDRCCTAGVQPDPVRNLSRDF